MFVCCNCARVCGSSPSIAEIIEHHGATGEIGLLGQKNPGERSSAELMAEPKPEQLIAVAGKAEQSAGPYARIHHRSRDDQPRAGVLVLGISSLVFL